MTEEKQNTDEAVLVEVPTQTGIAFKLADGTIIDDRGLLVKIYNDIQKIRKAI